jgi:alpha-D-xyloside xylohydrolase
MEVGNGASLQPWEILDETELGWYRDFTRLHLRLFPTVWSYAARLAVDGRPILRPLGLAYPDLRDAPSEAYLLGDWLLVHPVVDAGALTREVHLPPGRWVDWYTGEIVDGDAVIEVAAPLDRVPVHLAEGGIVPMLRSSIDTLSPTSDPTVDSYATDPGVVTVRVFPGPVSSFTLYDGARVHQDATLDGATLTWSDGEEFRSGALFEVVGSDSVTSVALDGEVLEVGDPDLGTGWSWDGAMARIPVPAGEHEVALIW